MALKKRKEQHAAGMAKLEALGFVTGLVFDRPTKVQQAALWRVKHS